MGKIMFYFVILWPLIICWSLAGISLHIYPEIFGRILFMIHLILGGVFNQIWVKYLDLTKKTDKILDFFCITARDIK